MEEAIKTLTEYGVLGLLVAVLLWWIISSQKKQVEAMESMIEKLMLTIAKREEVHDVQVEAFTDAVNNQTRAMENLTDKLSA